MRANSGNGQVQNYLLATCVKRQQVSVPLGASSKHHENNQTLESLLPAVSVKGHIAGLQGRAMDQQRNTTYNSLCHEIFLKGQYLLQKGKSSPQK